MARGTPGGAIPPSRPFGAYKPIFRGFGEGFTPERNCSVFLFEVLLVKNHGLARLIPLWVDIHPPFGLSQLNTLL